MGEKTVYVGLLNFIFDDDINRTHKQLYETQRAIKFDELDYNTFALLHEIGHVMSREKYENLERAIANSDTAMHNFKINHPYATMQEELEHYMELPLEMDADNWAHNYYMNNKEKVLRFQKKYLKTLDKLFKTVLD